MSDWNPERYLRFKKERTQPAIDLVMRVKTVNGDIRSVVDIGCGPGNSTAIIHEAFPSAEIIGIDNSENMIEKAMTEHPDYEFRLLSAWDLEGKYDLIFSNACLQWIDDHERLLPFLMDHLNPKGILAVQVPNNTEEPFFKVLEETVRCGKWDFNGIEEKNGILPVEKYYDILSSVSNMNYIWETKYIHYMPDIDSMIDWTRGTRLRPYLASLSEEEGNAFISEIRNRAVKYYSPMNDGTYRFVFKWLFFKAVNDR